MFLDLCVYFPSLGGLREYFSHALLPAETFFHMTLRNSEFCGTTLNNNLHLTNWRRKQGCKCQHKGNEKRKQAYGCVS